MTMWRSQPGQLDMSDYFIGVGQKSGIYAPGLEHFPVRPIRELGSSQTFERSCSRCLWIC